MLLCALILVCALNPSLTERLAGWVSGSEMVQTDDTNNEDGVMVPEGDQMAENTTQENSADTGTLTNSGVYVPPALEDVESPNSVKDRNGYEPVWEDGQEIGQKDAEELQEALKTGDTGENISFDTKMYPYYGMLNKNMQALYRQIYANALVLTTSFAPVVEVSVDEVKNVFEAVYNDHPELFWVETGYSCKYLQNGKCVELTLQYYNIASDLKEASKQFDAAAKEILDGAKDLKTDAEKERYIHDELVKSVDYHAGTAMGQSAYSALVSGRSVCAGYARAFQYLMMELDIPCYYCTGYSGQDHAWNIVELDDGFYNVDVTWDDTDPATYNYFNKSDADYAKTHMRKGMSVKLPVCIGEDYRKENAEVVEPELETEEIQGDGENATDNIHNMDADDLINDYPSKPLVWEDSSDDEEVEDEKPWEEIGLKEEDILDTLEEYYADCLKQMKKVGSGQKQFTNVIPKSLWAAIERVYSDGSYEKGYVEAALKELGMENFAIQLQTERLSGTYYRLYHNISTWK